jgi:hypothetical protein
MVVRMVVRKEPMDPYDWEPIDNYETEDDNDPGPDDVMLGTAEVLGVLYHAQAVRVAEDEHGLQLATLDPCNRFAELCLMDHPDGSYQTVEIPGHAGEYVVWLVPYCN